MVTRRQVLAGGAVAGAALLIPAAFRVSTAGASPVPGGTLDPTFDPEVHNAAVHPAGDAGQSQHIQCCRRLLDRGPTDLAADPAVREPGHDRVRLRWQQLLASTTRPTRSRRAPLGRSGSPGPTNWWTRHGNFLPHLLPVDPTLHWANPPGGTSGRDSRPTFTSTPRPYRGPVPLVTHLHGAHTSRRATVTPRRGTCPAPATSRPGTRRRARFYDQFKSEAQSRFGVELGAGNGDLPVHQRPAGHHRSGTTATNSA